MNAAGPEPRRSVEDIAVQHFARSRSGNMTPAEATELDRWLSADRSHFAAYQMVQTAWADADDLRSDPTVLAMREEALRSLAGRRRRRLVVGSLAASVLVTLAGTGFWWLYRHGADPRAAQTARIEGQQYVTRTGELKSVALADGSLAILDSGTAIRSRIGAKGVRRVQLVSGRALFAVSKNPARQFVVQAGDASITALGTRFDVYQRPDGLDVNLVEGRLRVEPPRRGTAFAGGTERVVEMISGDRLTIGKSGWHLTNGAADRATDWTKGQLVFDNAPIGTVIAELNRYTERKIVLVGDPSTVPPISAVIRTRDPLMFLRAADAMGIGQSRETPAGHEIVLRK